MHGNNILHRELPLVSRGEEGQLIRVIIMATGSSDHGQDSLSSQGQCNVVAPLPPPPLFSCDGYVHRVIECRGVGVCVLGGGLTTSVMQCMSIHGVMLGMSRSSLVPRPSHTKKKN